MDYPELNAWLILGIIFLLAVSIGMIALLIRSRLSLTARIVISVILVGCLIGAVILSYFLYRAVTPQAGLPFGFLALLAGR